MINSSVAQNLILCNRARQLEGQTLHKTFIDKILGKSRKRPQLEALLDYAREGDTILVHSMDRLARNLDALRRLVIFELVPQKITVKFLTEGLTFSGKNRSDIKVDAIGDGFFCRI